MQINNDQNSSNTNPFQEKLASHKKGNPVLLIIIFLVIIFGGFAGSFYYFNNFSQETSDANLATDINTPAENLLPPSATPAYENPFIEPTTYKNPFGNYENPFSEATQSAEKDSQAYQNPFAE